MFSKGEIVIQEDTNNKYKILGYHDTALVRCQIIYLNTNWSLAKYFKVGQIVNVYTDGLIKQKIKKHPLTSIFK